MIEIVGYIALVFFFGKFCILTGERIAIKRIGKAYQDREDLSMTNKIDDDLIRESLRQGKHLNIPDGINHKGVTVSNWN